MQVSAIPGQSYALTATAPCAVSATGRDGGPVSVLDAPAPGQYLIVSPAAALEISDSNALLTPVRSRAGVAACAAPRLSYACAETLQTLEGGGSNMNAHGFGVIMEHSGALKSVAVRARASGTLPSVPFWLKVWTRAQGEVGAYVYRGTSFNGVRQALGAYGKWHLPGIHLKAGEGFLCTFHAEAHKNTSAWGDCATGGMRVCSSGAAPGVGCVRSPVNPPVMYSNLPDYALELANVSGVRAGGFPLALAGDLTAHAERTDIHLTPEQREAWNGKADAAALSAKLNSSTFTAHQNDADAHLTTEEHLSLKDLITHKDALLALLNAPQEQTA